MKIYLAGPEVFFPNAEELGRLKKEICKQYGHEGLFPLDAQVKSDPDQSKHTIADDIFLANEELMWYSNATIANLSPYRGPSADAGTIWEVGCTYGDDKTVLGYTNTLYDFEDRSHWYVQEKKRTTYNYPDTEIEDFGLQDNLMIDCSLTKPTILTPTNDILDLRGFRKCVELLEEFKPILNPADFHFIGD